MTSTDSTQCIWLIYVTIGDWIVKCYHDFELSVHPKNNLFILFCFYSWAGKLFIKSYIGKSWCELIVVHQNCFQSCGMCEELVDKLKQKKLLLRTWYIVCRNSLVAATIRKWRGLTHGKSVEIWLFSTGQHINNLLIMILGIQASSRGRPTLRLEINRKQVVCFLEDRDAQIRYHEWLSRKNCYLFIVIKKS